MPCRPAFFSSPRRRAGAGASSSRRGALSSRTTIRPAEASSSSLPEEGSTPAAPCRRASFSSPRPKVKRPSSRSRRGSGAAASAWPRRHRTSRYPVSQTTRSAGRHSCAQTTSRVCKTPWPTTTPLGSRSRDDHRGGPRPLKLRTKTGFGEPTGASARGRSRLDGFRGRPAAFYVAVVAEMADRVMEWTEGQERDGDRVDGVLGD